MDLLKKIRSATLIEALVATVLIVIVFVIASLVLNNLLFNTFSRNMKLAETRMAELEYLVKNHEIKLPYREDFKHWTIELDTEKSDDKIWLISKAINKNNKKTTTKSRLYAEE